MKIKRLEQMRESQRNYHRRCQWVMKDGLFIPHVYEESRRTALSWWDDVGFILGDRRVMVRWRHPRMVYEDETQERAWNQAGEPPQHDIFADFIPNYQQAGRSRKRIASYTQPTPQGELGAYYDKVDAITNTLRTDGIDFDVHASYRRERLSWSTSVHLVVPLEVRDEAELRVLADLGKRLLQGKTTLEQEFPGYRYGREQWLAECETMQEDLKLKV
ncbi:hypothetical protein [Castellaniella sp.]|uniref:hypothetical protein n=1 Tax=Castellaniella sp. TaxID=1955812 RepID=UPI002AFF9E4A|nr:hypothetical protein [Castellaniella sp.]